MKKILPFLFMAFMSYSYSQCEYYLALADSYGDSWNGADVTMYINGSIVYENITNTDVDGVEGSLEYNYAGPFTVNVNDVISFSWVSGEYDNEISLFVIDYSGNIYYSTVFGGEGNQQVGSDCSLSPASAVSSFDCIDNSCQELSNASGEFSTLEACQQVCGNTTSNIQAAFTTGSDSSVFLIDEVISFTDSSTGGPVEWLWDFGDGNASVVQNPQYSYEDEGFYTVTLEVTDSLDNTSSTSQSVLIIDPCNIADDVYLINLAFSDAATEANTIWGDYYDLPQSIQYNQTNPMNLLDPGRYVRFKVEAKNQNPDGTNLLGASCAVIIEDEYVQVIDSTAGLNNVAYQQTEWSTDEFEIYIKPETPPGHTIEFDFVVTQGSNNWYTRCIEIPVRPIVVSEMIIDDDANPDSDGNSNQVIEQGERIEVTPICENISDYTVNLLAGKFSSTNTCIDIKNNWEGVSGTVVSSSWWNYAFNEPQPIEPGDDGMQPQFDFVFDYDCNDDPFELSVLFVGGFDLFDHFQSFTSNTLIRYSYPTGYNGWEEFGSFDCNAGSCVEASSGDGEFSSLIACQQNCSGAININDDISNDIEIFPNPSNGVINIKFEQNALTSSSKFTIVNLLGDLVFSGSLESDISVGSTQVNLSNISKGVYFLNFNTSGSTICKKIILE
tara:strand:- start:14359 stop:16362 length:2004 start_codon:yes stop_codon:yes gene_type:complete